MERRLWVFAHWKLGFHLLFRTKRFGVDNRWWSSFDSMFGYPLWKIALRVILVYPLFREYWSIKARTVGAHLLTPEIRRLLWQRHPS